MHDLSLMTIGRRIRHRRQQLKKTLDEVARAAGLSCGLISKIENFRTVPSLPVLARISAALDTDMADFVAGVTARTTADAYTVIRRDERVPMEREEAKGFQYEAIFSKETAACFWQSVVLTLQPGAQRPAATTDGDEFLLVLSGNAILRIGTEAVELAEGDAIFFDGRIPHTSQPAGTAPAVLFVAYFLEPANH